MNFVFVSFGDNDFGHDLQEAVEHVWVGKEKELTEDEFKFFVVNYLTFKQAIQRIHPGFITSDKRFARLKQYFQDAISVHYMNKRPEVDHDGGSVYLDNHTGVAYRIQS